MAIHYAHLAMLAERGIVSAARRARDPCRARRYRPRRDPGVAFDGSLRGSLLLRERLIAGSLRRDVAGRLAHCAQSQ